VGMSRLEHLEGNGELAFIDGSAQGLKGTHGQVDGHLVVASGALVGDSNSDRLAVLGVGDLNLLAAVLATSVQRSLQGADNGRVGVDFPASAFNAVLGEVGSYSTGSQATTA